MSESERRSVMVTTVMVLFLLSGFLGAVALGAVRVDPAGWTKGVLTGRVPAEDPDFLYAQALEYYKDDNKTMARAVARRAVIVNQKYAPAHKLLAAIALRDKDYKAAETASRNALAADPQDRDAQIAYATSIRGAGRSKEAKTLFEAIAKDKNTPLLHRREAEQHLTDLPGGVATPVAPAQNR